MPKINNWKDIHLLFNEEHKEQWISQGFTFEETFDWVGIGLSVNDAYFAAYLRDIKKKDSEWVLNYGDDESLRAEYKEYQFNCLKNLNVPTHTPGAFTWKKPWIILLIAVIALYLLTK